LSFSRSSSPNFDDQGVHERVISNQEFNSLEENNRQVILAKAEGYPVTPPTRGPAPSNFPVTPFSVGRPSRPVSGVNPSRTTSKVVDQEFGAGANPAGAGGGGENANFDEPDKCPAPQKQKLDQKTPEFYSKKKKSED